MKKRAYFGLSQAVELVSSMPEVSRCDCLEIERLLGVVMRRAKAEGFETPRKLDLRGAAVKISDRLSEANARVQARGLFPSVRQRRVGIESWEVRHE